MDAAFKPKINDELDTQNFMKFDEVKLLAGHFVFICQDSGLVMILEYDMHSACLSLKISSVLKIM